jgi:hypothetical protein
MAIVAGIALFGVVVVCISMLFQPQRKGAFPMLGQMMKSEKIL